MLKYRSLESEGERERSQQQQQQQHGCLCQSFFWSNRGNVTADPTALSAVVAAAAAAARTAASSPSPAVSSDDENAMSTTAIGDTAEDEIAHLSTSTWGSQRRRDSLRQSGALSLSAAVLHDISVLIEDAKYDDAIEKCFASIDVTQTGYLNRDALFVFLQEATASAKSRINIPVRDEIIHLAVDALIASVQQDDSVASLGDEEERGDGHAASASIRGPPPVEDGITREQFFRIFAQNPSLYSVFESSQGLQKRTRQSHARLSKLEIETQRTETEELWKHARIGWKNYGLCVAWIALYVAAYITIIARAAVKWANDAPARAVFGNCVVVARSCAAGLNLHAALILLPVGRHALTWLRLTKAARYLFPFDVALEAHIMIGWLFGALAATHTLAHLCDYVRLVESDQADLEALLLEALGEIPTSRAGRLLLLMKQRATITGIIMVFCFALAYPVLLSRRENFNRFWYLHHLLILVLVMMCVHGTGNLLQPFQTVYWVCGPLALYIVPRIYREVNCRAVRVLGVNIHDDVLGLKLAKPPGWEKTQRAGMYAFINIPAISRFEWHPFTLSSSPHQDHIGFHIKAAGDWTKKAHALMMEKSIDGDTPEDASKASFMPVARSDQMSTKVYVEGPIGASSQGFSDHAVIVLVGAGIGVTPMVSVIRMLLAKPGKMRRAFFYWTVRDVSAFGWFNKLMEDIFEQDTNRVLEVRHFLTSAKRDDRDIGAVMFHYAANAIHADTNIDVVLGHRSRHQVQVGRPDWDVELSHVVQITKEMGENDCGVFLCGPEVMAEAVAESCSKLTRKESEFHLYFAKETF